MTGPLNGTGKGKHRWHNVCRELLLSPQGVSRFLNLALAKSQTRLGVARMEEILVAASDISQ